MSNDLDYLFKPIVLVTGFGPFANHPVNASWEGVKLMNKDEIEKKHNIELVQIEIPSFTLEMQAHRKGYQRMDYLDKCPVNHICPVEGAIRLHTKLNVERICKEFNECFDVEKMKAVSSKDAGRYLCEYIYYTSLSADNARSLFVHVPDLTIYSAEETARGLEKVLDLCMEQLFEIEDSKEVSEKLQNT
ncbi:Pyroglutamyl-peptidase 1, partial [Operophtera brumata]